MLGMRLLDARRARMFEAEEWVIGLIQWTVVRCWAAEIVGCLVEGMSCPVHRILGNWATTDQDLIIVVCGLGLILNWVKRRVPRGPITAMENLVLRVGLMILWANNSNRIQSNLWDINYQRLRRAEQIVGRNGRCLEPSGPKNWGIIRLKILRLLNIWCSELRMSLMKGFNIGGTL